MNEWWRAAVIYQIYPRSFQDDSGDGIGDLPGITRRLEHIAHLGADAIWISPFFRSPMKDMGYDISDPCDVDPLFGDLADFDALIARAHELGLKVIIDQVLSHTSDAHAWFVDSRASRTGEKADWYVWADPKPDGSPPNNWPSVFGGPAWTWDTRRRQYYMHNFLSTQPDVNMHNPAVQDGVLAALKFWLDRGVDGFRLDSINYCFHDRQLRDNPRLEPFPKVEPHNPYDFQDHKYSKSQPEMLPLLERVRALLDRYDDRMTVGEVGDHNHALELMSQYTAGEKRMNMAYSFDMLGPDYSARHFRGVIDRFMAGAKGGWPCWSFSNHDVPRHVSRWAGQDAGGDALARQAIALLLAFEGAVCVYQGEEFGQTETQLAYEELTDPVGLRFWPDNKGRDGCRTPMVWERDMPAAGFTSGVPWLPIKPEQRVRAASEQMGVAGSVFEHYRDVIAFRKQTEALKTGGTRFLNLPEPLLGFLRGEGPGAVLCLFNLSAEEVALPEGLMTEASGRPVGPAEGVGVAGRLGPNGYVFLQS
ncbi:alpha-amylase family glycosyl hydrolase [Frigidibacter sp. MR17.14]|uniref:alpha-amylase family glycosyl hydrolase n=1 Tax=Frigidibacter sp. MR17.14 TaxID=3126509 RepID=UPI0030130252